MGQKNGPRYFFAKRATLSGLVLPESHSASKQPPCTCLN